VSAPKGTNRFLSHLERIDVADIINLLVGGGGWCCQMVL